MIWELERFVHIAALIIEFVLISASAYLQIYYLQCGHYYKMYHLFKFWKTNLLHLS